MQTADSIPQTVGHSVLPLGAQGHGVLAIKPN